MLSWSIKNAQLEDAKAGGNNSDDIYISVLALKAARSLSTFTCYPAVSWHRIDMVWKIPRRAQHMAVLTMISNREEGSDMH